MLTTSVWIEASAGDNRVWPFTGKVDSPAAAARRPAICVGQLILVAVWPRLALAQSLLRALQQGAQEEALGNPAPVINVADCELISAGLRRNRSRSSKGMPSGLPFKAFNHQLKLQLSSGHRPVVRLPWH